MHSLYIEQKMFSLWGTYDVYDEEGRIAYKVKGSPSLTRTLTVFDAEDNEAGTIHQVLMSLLPTFEIMRHKEKIGTLQKKLSFLHPKLIMHYLDWHAEGNIWGWDYTVYDGAGQTIGTIQTKIWHLTDQFSIEYVKECDALPLLMLVLAIDAIQDAGQHG